VKETERRSRSLLAIASFEAREREREKARRLAAGRHGVGREGSDPRLGFGRGDSVVREVE